jgi:hypothetical protein
MTKHVIAPFNPTEAQWGGLARSIVWWMRSYPSNKHTPSTLVEHLGNLGHEIPAWMGDEAELRTKDHVISKGTIAVLIYKAMLAELPEAPPVYLYRRKGQDDFATCDHGRFEELSNNHLFETRTVFPSSSFQPYEILTGLKQVPVTYAANTGEQPASPLKGLREAWEFQQKCEKDYSEARDTGALKDADEWVRCELKKLMREPNDHALEAPKGAGKGSKALVAALADVSGHLRHFMNVFGQGPVAASQALDKARELIDTYPSNADQLPVSDFPDAYLIVSKSYPNMTSVCLSNPVAANRDLFDVFELSVHRVPHWTDPHIQWDGSEWVGYDEAGLELTRNVERDKVRDALVIYSHNQLGLPV